MNKLATPYRPIMIIAPGILAGAEKVVLTGVSALHDIGLNPLLVIIKESRVPHFADQFQAMVPKNIEVVVVTSIRALDTKLPNEIKNALKKTLGENHSPVIFHSHGFKALIAAYFIKKQFPHVHTHHGNTSHTFKVRLYEKLSSIVMKKCQQVIAVSSEMKESLIETLRPYNRITVIDNMLSFKNAERIRKLRSEEPLQNSKIKLLFVGRLSPEKGLLPFLEFWIQFKNADAFELLILGDGIERAAIESFIQTHQLQPKVTMLGFVSDPSESFIQPDLLIMPSLREGLPMTLIEALASGIPVLAHNVGALKSLVTHQHNGFLVEDMKAESWLLAFEQTVQNISIWKTNAANEARSVEEKFSAKKWAEKTRAVYLEFSK